MNPISRKLWNSQTATEEAHEASILLAVARDASTSTSLRILIRGQES